MKKTLIAIGGTIQVALAYARGANIETISGANAINSRLTTAIKTKAP